MYTDDQRYLSCKFLFATKVYQFDPIWVNQKRHSTLQGLLCLATTWNYYMLWRHLHLKISTGRSTLEDGGSGHLWTLVNCQRILHGGFVCLARTSRLHVTSTEVAGERMLSKEGLPPCYFLNILSRWAWNKPLQRTCWTRWRKGSCILTKWLYCKKNLQILEDWLAYVRTIIPCMQQIQSRFEDFWGA